MKKIMLILVGMAIAQIGFGKTVGLWKDARSLIREGMLQTIHEAGWETVILEGKDLADEAKLAGLDVVFLPAGHNAYQFADFDARRALIRYTAGGGGLLAGANRGGYVRTANRPFFPQVGEVYNRVNGPWFQAYGDSALAKSIYEPFCPGNWDHLVIKVGQDGKIFAVSAGDPVGVYGEIYGGRHVLFGAYIGLNSVTEPMTGPARDSLLAMLDWLAGAPKLSAADKAKHQAQADLDFLRRERLYDWTLHERGPDRSPGIVASIRHRLAVPLESRLFRLQYMSKWLTGKDRDACMSATENMEQTVEGLDTRYKKEIADIRARINAMDAETLAAKDFTETFVDRDAVRERLLPESALNQHIAAAEKVIKELWPKVETAKAERAAEERKLDLAKTPSLTAACKSENPATRLEAVIELGRIGDPDTAGTLLKMLADPDTDVRVAAITGLGWMQSKQAVPELIKIASAKDIRAKRRAVQALGQIGDPRAVPVLLEKIDDPDTHTSDNAILALGWLKAKKAVPVFLKQIAARDGVRPQRIRAMIRALGQIGDPEALPVLKQIADEAGDYPVDRRRKKKIPNIYSLGIHGAQASLGLQGHAELAIEKIETGGRDEVGVSQAGFLAQADNFYSLTRRFNALAGRTEHIRSPNANFGDDPAALWAYLWEAGFTGVHQAWGEAGHDPDEYIELIDAAGDFDLIWFDVMPGGRSANEKPDADMIMESFRGLTAFKGFWSEETYPGFQTTPENFEVWLTDRHGKKFREKLGLPADYDLSQTAWNTWSDKGGAHGGSTNVYSGPLKTEFLRMGGENLIDNWRESQEWLRGLRKGFAFTFSVSDAEPVYYPGVTARLGHIIDANGPQTYQCFGRFNTFFMEMHKDGEARPVMSEFYNWYSPGPANDIRGFAQHLMHGECFYNFHIDHIFGQAGWYNMWSWDAERWNSARRIFRKARDIREYIAVPESASNVGLVLSDLSTTVFYPISSYVGGLRQGWMQHQSALWTALNQSHIPTDIIWAETMTSEKLARYKVLVMAEIRILTDRETAVIAEWVRNGGILIASGTTSLFNEWGNLQKNYSLSEVFGVDYAGHVSMDDPEKIDTYWWRKEESAKGASKMTPGLIPANFKNVIHRDIKPVKSLDVYTVTDKDGKYLPGIESDTEIEYDMPLGYDKVKPGSAQVLAKFANDDPALTVNRSGSGLCYFWTIQYPGLTHVTSNWDIYPNTLDFWPNTRELLEAMVRGGLRDQEATLPVEISNASKEIEVSVRKQPENNRMMVHLLNYDINVDLVENAEMTFYPPEGVSVKKVYYPDTDTELKFEATEKGVDVKLRDFDVHDMVVVEW